MDTGDDDDGQVPRLETVPCRFKLAPDQVPGKTVICSDLVVYEDRDRPDAQIRLHAARYPGKNPDAAPLVYLWLLLARVVPCRPLGRARHELRYVPAA